MHRYHTVCGDDKRNKQNKLHSNLRQHIRNAIFTNKNCMVSSYSQGDVFQGRGGECAVTDDVCRDVVYQSSRGAFARWASQAKLQWSILACYENYWKPDCVVSMADLKNVENAAETIKGALQANVIICAFAKFFLSMLFPTWIYIAKYGSPPCLLKEQGQDSVHAYS